MRCPVDNETLVMTERYGIEIDYCPKCRGVWLDRGELDKIIERALAEGGAAAVPAPRPVAAQPGGAPVYQPEPQRRDERGDYRSDSRGRDRDEDDDYRYKKKRKESFLSDLFDF